MKKHLIVLSLVVIVLVSGIFSFNRFGQLREFVNSIASQGSQMLLAGPMFSDGALDKSFEPKVGTLNATIGPSRGVITSAIQSDGKIVIGGYFTEFETASGKTSRPYIARLNVDGSLDTSFVTENGFDKTVDVVIVQKDGKIVVGGRFASYRGISRNGIARLNVDGSLDNTFNPGKGVFGIDPYVTSIAIQPDGKIIIGGYFDKYNDTIRTKIARLNSDGSLDATFSLAGGGLKSSGPVSVRSIAIQPDGKIIIGGTFDNYNNTPRKDILRLNADGTLDTTFTIPINPPANNNYILAITLQPDGKILVGGIFVSYGGISRGSIMRLNTNGSLDTTFNPGAGVDNTDPRDPKSVHAIAVQSDGKILIGGYFLTYDSVSRNNIARLNADGSLDTTFAPGSGTATTQGGISGLVMSIALQSDGKAIIGGDFTSYNGVARSRIARLSNGELPIDVCPNIEGMQTTIPAGMIKDASGNCVLTVVLDSTPRIAYISGLVNQHVDALGNWFTDPDGVSGANLDKLAYCRKWYPNTVSVEPYKTETITTWRARGNTGAYTREVVSDKCVQGVDICPNITGIQVTVPAGMIKDASGNCIVAPVTLDPTPRIMYWYGKVNQHVDALGNWLTDPDGRSGASIDKLAYCKKWYPNTVSVEPYKTETVTWRAAGNTGAYPYAQVSDKCVQSQKVGKPTMRLLE